MPADTMESLGFVESMGIGGEGSGMAGPDGTRMFYGKYRATEMTYAETPVIDVSKYEMIRLQYRRWLTVDHAECHGFAGLDEQSRLRGLFGQGWLRQCSRDKC